MGFKTVLLRKIVTEKTGNKIASIISFIFAVLIFFIGIHLLINMNISSIEQLFLAIAIIFILFFQLIIMGLITEVLSKIQNLEEKIKG